MDLKALLFETDPLATFALAGLLVTIIVTLGILSFVVAKLPKRR